MRVLSFAILLLLSCEEFSDFYYKKFKRRSTAADKLFLPKISVSKAGNIFYNILPVKKGVVIDYAGNAVANQLKQDGIVQYDVGRADLQQCADALMRIRAEYLFSKTELEK